MMRPGRRVQVVLLFVGTTLLSFTVASAAGQIVPPSRQASPPQVARTSPEPQLVLLGRGPQDAARVIANAQGHSSLLPFTPMIPARLPSGYRLAQAELRVQAGQYALLDIAYVADGNAQIQLFQSNYPNSKQVSAPVQARDELAIGGAGWRYLLLRFPQPGGTPLVVHFAERPFDGHTYMSVGLDSHGSLATEKAQLIEIIASLS